MNLSHKLGKVMQELDDAEAAVIEAFDQYMLNPCRKIAKVADAAGIRFEEAVAQLHKVHREIMLRERLFMEANEIRAMVDVAIIDSKREEKCVDTE